MDIDSLQVNPEAISEGRWIKDLPQMGDLELLVRGMTSPQVIDLRRKKVQGVPRNMRNRDGSPHYSEMVRITTEVLHEAVLLDWKGLVQKGKPIKYDKDLAKLWLTDPRFRRFADAVVEAAEYVDNSSVDAAAFDEDVAGNSPKR